MTTLMKGETLDGVSPGVDVALHREPLGVVAGVTPFNFPMMIPLWFAPLAIATGNAFILKPSQRTPLSAMRLADLFSEAGFPDGVFNVVHGARETVEALIDHPQVEAISSVGGSEAARNIYRRAADRGKRVQALGGAKNHIVVMPDADLEAAAQGVFSSAFSNGGQRCLAGSVGVAVGGIGDELVERLAKVAGEAQIGSGLNREMDSGTGLTPVTSAEAKEKFSGWKDSFFGDLHATGRDGVEFYTERKVVIERWPKA